MALVKGTNSYVSVDEADAYFVDRVHGGAWDVDVIQQDTALVTATGILDLLPWAGVAAAEDQPLSFPRDGYYYSTSRARSISFDSDATEVPLPVKVATYELALHLLQNTDILNNSATIDNLSLGAISLDDIKNPAILPGRIRRYVRELLNNGGGRQWFRSW